MIGANQKFMFLIKHTILTGCVAQLAEHRAFNLMAVGSSPTIPILKYVLFPAEKRKWLSRQAHNLKAVGSNPTSAHIFLKIFYYVSVSFFSMG